MFKLRTQHMEAFRASAMADFEGRGLAHIRDWVPDETRHLSDRQVIDRIRSCLPRAKSFGLTTEIQVMDFVDVSYMLGEFFDSDPEFPWALDVLQSAKLTPDEKSELLANTARIIYQEKRAGRV